MINIHINGEPFEVPEKTNIEQALFGFLTETQQTLSYAVALNSDFVSKGHYQATLLNDNDSLDVLFPIHGG